MDINPTINQIIRIILNIFTKYSDIIQYQVPAHLLYIFDARCYMQRFMFALLFSSLFFAGCGQITSGESNITLQPSGMYVDQSTENFLKVKFDELKECGNFKTGEFDELSVVIMPPKFPCKWYESGCGGEFLAPNSIKISSHYYWKHELIHFFLYKTTGDPDTNHMSSLYETCI